MRTILRRPAHAPAGEWGLVAQFPAPLKGAGAHLSACPAFEDEAVQAEAGVWGRSPQWG
ncbi:hypothetical protein GCM10010317_088230 [Streptomyces mirabilis]|nr:hypothetical protein GCM10010317_088230 [Streptomyces mirabilis]